MPTIRPCALLSAAPYFSTNRLSAPQLILDERVGLLTMRLDGPVTPDMVCALESAGASSL